MRALITGGAGFIGSHIAERLCGEGGHDVRVLDNLRTGRRENLAGLDVAFHEGCVTDAAAVRAALEGVDTVFHLAALVSVQESMADPELCVRLNTLGTLNLIRCAAEAGVRRIVFSSTSAVYGEVRDGPLVETRTPAPQSPYAVTKLDAEYYLRIYAPLRGFSFAALRYFNVYGPRQDPASPYAAVLPLFVSRALLGEDLCIYGDGGQTRDFVFVRDVAAANLWAARYGEGVYNVGTGRGISIRELAEDVLRLTGSLSRIVHAEPRPGDIRHSRADISRLCAAGFEPERTREEGVRETVEFFRRTGTGT